MQPDGITPASSATPRRKGLMEQLMGESRYRAYRAALPESQCAGPSPVKGPEPSAVAVTVPIPALTTAPAPSTDSTAPEDDPPVPPSWLECPQRGERYYWPPGDKGKPIVSLKDSPLVQIVHATSDLAPRKVYSSIDHKLVTLSADGSRILYLSRPVVDALMNDASLWLQEPPPKARPRTVEKVPKKAGEKKTSGKADATTPDGTAPSATTNTTADDDDIEYDDIETVKTLSSKDGMIFETTKKIKNGVVLKTTIKQVGQTFDIEKAPQKIVDAVFERGEYPELPELRGIRTYPYGAPDGSLVTEAGYDPRTKLILAPKAAFDLPARPTLEQAKAWVKELLHPFRQFPIVGQAWSVVLAFLVQIVMRPAIDAAPGFVFSAPTPGTGKTQFAVLLARIATGLKIMLSPSRRNAEEREKSFASSLRLGLPVLIEDNTGASIGGETHEAVTTDPTGEVLLRLLGSSTMERVPTKVTLAFTGNNPTVTGDMPRRLLYCELDAKIEHPEERQFEIEDLGEWMDKHLHRQSWLLFAVIHAFHVDGCPRSGSKSFGYPSWDRLVRDLCIWVGVGDPKCGYKYSKTRSADDALLAELLPLIQKTDKGAGLSAQEIVRAFGANDAALDGFKQPNGIVNVVSLGKHLSKKKGHIVNGLKLAGAGNKEHNLNRWRVVDAAYDDAAETTPSERN